MLRAVVLCALFAVACSALELKLDPAFAEQWQANHNGQRVTLENDITFAANGTKSWILGARADPDELLSVHIMMKHDVSTPRPVVAGPP